MIPGVNRKAAVAAWLQAQWYDNERPGPWLTGAETLFRRAVALRRKAYREGRRPVERLPVPVVVVGNLTVGGTGKTPLTLWLADFLRQAGYRPGIISRGYGGRRLSHPLQVGADTPPGLAGDEPVLIARRAGCPVGVFPRRAEAARALLAQGNVDLILADDGLQHYALGRDLEIALIDGARGLGNGHCLPAGPLREPPERLDSVDFVVWTGRGPAGATVMTLAGDRAVNLLDPALSQPLDRFAGQTVCAVAGIGHPPRFFRHLEDRGLTLVARAFPDHHVFRPGDIAFAGAAPLLMTEKDAVKCAGFARPNHWYVPVAAELPADFGARFLTQLKNPRHGQETA